MSATTIRTARVPVTAAILPRSRVRMVDLTPKEVVVEVVVQPVADLLPALQDTAKAKLVAYVQANAQKNKYMTEANKAEKELLAAMVEAKMTDVSSEVTALGKTATWSGVIAAQTANYIDVAVLKGLVSADDFLKIVKAAASEVEKVAGSNIATQATRTKTKPASLLVKADKG